MMRSFLPLLVTSLLAHVATAQVNSSSICSSAAFQATTGTRLGDSPIFVRALVQGDEVCIEYQLEASVASEATWFGVGPTRSPAMVNSPPSNAMMFFRDTGMPVSYLLGGYINRDITQENDQSIFTVGATSTASMSFSFQRQLAAATSSEVALSITQSTFFIWAYGTRWPISSHRSGTNGVAMFNVGLAASSNAGASTTVSSGASTAWCADKNCPGIVGGIAFALMTFCGLLVTVVLKSSPAGKLLLHRTVISPPVKWTTNALVAKPHVMFLQTLADLHYGELLVMLIFIAAVIVLIALLSDEMRAIVSGQVGLLVLMFVILPVSRLPVWSVFFGTSFERMIKFHRWLGITLNVVLVIHVIQGSDVVDLTLNEKYGEVTPLYGFIAFLCFIGMAVLSIEPMRRMFFEVFYFTHRVLSIVGFVFAILHAPRLVGPALCVPLGLYALGLLYRWSSAFTSSYKISASVHPGSNMTTLVLKATEKTGKMAMKVKPGSYFMVRLPAISATQWHPFSSIVTQEGDSIGFCIKAMGSGSFTRKLLEKVKTQYDLTANLCGPFGKISIDVEAYDAVILVAGGVGITPLANLINKTRLFPETKATTDSDKALKVADWFVVWSVRELEDILVMEEFLPTHAQLDFASRSSIQDFNTVALGNFAPVAINIKWVFHVSNARTSGVVTRANGETLSYHCGKPILDEWINTSRFGGRKVTVVACGPPSMTVEAQSLARDCRFDFHKEIFNW